MRGGTAYFDVGVVSGRVVVDYSTETICVEVVFEFPEGVSR